jgi:hypothetical protein
MDPHIFDAKLGEEINVERGTSQLTEVTYNDNQESELSMSQTYSLFTLPAASSNASDYQVSQVPIEGLLQQKIQEQPDKLTHNREA